MAGELTYAGQGYCFTLARFAVQADAEILVSYMEWGLCCGWTPSWADASRNAIDTWCDLWEA
nr:DUF6000 family protein [Streptomyces sp. S3(2020)]